MSRNTQTPFILFSVELSTLAPETNAGRVEFASRQLDAAKVDFSRVNGSYKGSREISFLVLVPEGDSSGIYETVRTVARLYGQESILYVDSERRASLDYLNGNPWDHIGIFHAVTSAQAAELDSWTQDGAGTYYAVG